MNDEGLATVWAKASSGMLLTLFAHVNSGVLGKVKWGYIFSDMWYRVADVDKIELNNVV